MDDTRAYPPRISMSNVLVRDLLEKCSKIHDSQLVGIRLRRCYNVELGPAHPTDSGLIPIFCIQPQPKGRSATISRRDELIHGMGTSGSASITSDPSAPFRRREAFDNVIICNLSIDRPIRFPQFAWALLCVQRRLVVGTTQSPSMDQTHCHDRVAAPTVSSWNHLLMWVQTVLALVRPDDGN